MTVFRRRLNHIKADSQRTGGFTLVELIVVLVVLAILCTGAVMGIIGWQDHADFKKQNQYAQNIFVAAQTQLTQYGERGQLTNLKDLVTDSGKADPKEYLLAAQGVLTDSDGNAFSASDDDVWQNDENAIPHKGDIYFLKAKKGDYQIYRDELKGLSSAQMKQQSLEKRRIRALFDMLDPYIADKSTFDAAICVEFSPDPKVGLVYSVFYNEKVDEFTYAEKTGTDTTTVSIRDRRESARKEDKIGYYGAEVLSRGTDTYIARPVISNVRLNNKEKLTLSWSVNSEEALYGLIYKLNLYSAPDTGTGDGVRKASIVIGKADKPKLELIGGHSVSGVYFRKDADGNDIQTELEFPVTINDIDKTITLVLDGVDLETDATSTASISRLGLTDVENIYVSISGSREGTFRLTAEKRSNTEHQFFGKYQKREQNGTFTQVYGIENARHLYNIRYREKNSAGSAQPMIYRISSDIDWEAAARSGNFYQSGIAIYPKQDEAAPRFKPMLSLGASSLLMSEEEDRPYQIQNLTMDIMDVPETENPEGALGLVVKNYGTIQNLILDNVTVTGRMEGGTGATGAFCGENQGSLKNLTVKTGNISGDSHVGGIVGSIKGYGTYEKLTNRATVSGNMYVGGITGSASSDGALQIEDCVNYGKVTGDSFYIGGIAGYAEASPGSTLTIRHCSSSPSYTESEIQSLIEQIKSGNTSGLTGTYVGGIVGFNQNATIDSCNTLREKANNPGYVIGKHYVGGIVGFHSGTAGLSGSENRNQANVIGENYVGGITGCNANGTIDPVTHQMTLKETPAPEVQISSWINEGVVLAAGNYAGGITGCNYGTILDCNSNVDYTEGVKNLTEVSTDSRYAGGIAGYNRGTIKSSDSARTISAVSAIAGKDYVGGIVGYNDIGGVISNYELKGGYIHGKKFVGGMIGLNASEQIFETPMICNLNEVTGDYFVGGIIGGNLLPTGQPSIESKLQTDNFLGNLNADQGAFAGGFIGYNYLLNGGTSQNLIQSTADELCTWSPVSATDPAAISQELQEKERQLENLFSGSTNTVTEMVITGDGAGSTQTRLGGITALVHVGGVIGYNQNNTKLTIRNVENITPVTATAYLTKSQDTTGIPGEKNYSYVGGIIGRVGKNVTLDNCHNRDVGEVRSQGTYIGGLAEVNYGRIENCTAGSLGSGEEDYIGGLVGANVAAAAGKGLVNCKVSGTVMGQSYVGGLTAENYGRIENPEIENCTIIASGNHVGGVTGYGYEGSTVFFGKDSVLDISISGGASNVGGIVGTNEGQISGGAEISNKAVSITGLDNVGGFIGLQKKDAGTLSGFKNYAEIEAEEGYAGGIVAWVTKAAKNTKLENCENFGAVAVLAKRSGDGNIEEDEVDNESSGGGITAINHGTITACVNYGEIAASGGYSGGITAINYGTITRSRVNEANALQGTLELSGDRYVGGIAAKNKTNAEISYSSVHNMILQNQTDSEHGYIGGITAENEGLIKACVAGVEWKPELNPDQKPDLDYEMWQGEAALSASEAMTAQKAGEYPYTLLSASGSLPEDSSGIVLISNAVNVSMGGVAGINTGTIQGDREENHNGYSVVAAELRFAKNSMNYYGYLGGIAGINQGVIRNYEFSGLVHGTANNPGNAPEYNPNYDYEVNGSTIYGYGGIAGINGSDKKAETAEIEHCRINAARIQGIGDANNRVNVGGVAGVNGVGADISGIQFGDVVDLHAIGGYKPVQYTVNTIKYEGSIWIGTDNYGHSGGVAGYNQGEIRDINEWNQYASHRETFFDKGKYSPYGNTDAENTGVMIINQTGHGGGIVGFNRRTGTIREAVTGKMWLVYTPNQGEDNAVGGIIGYNISERDLEYCDNHGTVIKTVGNSVGGIVGRNENAATSFWRFYECRNYGTILAAERAGGIVGHWKYKGGTLEKCRNYGVVTSTGSMAGGMVALFYRVLDNETVNMIDCENHGNVSSSSETGGMAGGNTGGSKNLNLNLAGAVNTGIINGGNSSGLVATSNLKSLRLSYCRNYGYSNRGNFGGLSFMKPTAMQECFAMTDQKVNKNPVYVDDKATSKAGYYFTADTGDDAEKHGIPLNVIQKPSPETGFMAVQKIKDGENSKEVVKIPDVGNYVLDEFSPNDILLRPNLDDRKKNSTLAYQLYKGFDPYLWTQYDPGDLKNKIPVIKQESYTDGYLQISWDGIPKAQYYTVTCQYFYKENPDDTNGKEEPVGTSQTYTSYTPNVNVSAEYAANGITANGVKVTVQAHAVTGATGEIVSSQVSSEKKLWLKILLPVPQVHWELVTLDSGNCYRITLDNRSEFEAFVNKYYDKYDIKLQDIQIKISAGDQKDLSFDAQTGILMQNGNPSLKPGSGIGNTTAISYAVTHKNGYAQSSKVIRETRLPKADQYTKTWADVSKDKTSVMARVSMEQGDKVGFFGSTIDALSYQLMLRTNEGSNDTNKWGIYYRAELVAKDPVLGIPVAYAVSAQNRLSPSNNDPIPVMLNGFPADFLEKEAGGNYRYQDVMVRSYPTKTPNDIGYCGWQVKAEDGTQTWSWEELQALTVNDTGAIGGNQDLVSGSTVCPGYVIEYAGPDTYSVYYNTLLRSFNNQFPEENSLKYQPFGETSTYMKNQVVYRALDLKTEIQNTQPKPVAYANAIYVPNTWQNGNYDGEDTFTVTWDQAAGVNPAYTQEDGTTIPYDGSAEYFLTVTGELQDGRKTTIVNNKSIKTSEKDDKGRYNLYEADASRWDYKNIHVTLTRVGAVDSKGNTIKFPSTAEFDFPMRRRLSPIGKPTVELQKDSNGVVMKDALNYVVSWSGLSGADELNALDCYEVIVTGADGQKPPVTFRTPADVPGQTFVNMDLGAFTRGERLEIALRAIAKNDSTTYRSSAPGTIREMTLPSRLLAPEMGQEGSAEPKMTAISASIIDVEGFEKECMKLQMVPDSYSAENHVKYQIALQVFDSEEEAAKADGIPVYEDGLPEKSDTNRTYMTEDGNNHNYSVGQIPARYAGLYLKVILRSVSQSNISSVWTEDDEDAEGYTKVTPYMIFQLPQVQVDSVTLSSETEIEPVSGFVKENGVESLTSVTVNREAMNFTTVNYADDYHLTIIETPQKAGDSSLGDWKISNVSEIDLKKQSDGIYQITYESTRDAYQKGASREPQILHVDGDPILLPYQKEILISGSANAGEDVYTVDAIASLRAETVVDENADSLEEQHIKFTLVLPDFTEIQDGSGIDGVAYTEQILIQSLVSQEQKYFKNSRWAKMARANADDVLEAADPIGMDVDAEDPAPIDSDADISNLQETAYTVSGPGLAGNTRFLVSVMKGTEELGVLAVPFTSGGINRESQVWLPVSFAEYADQTITLRFRNIFDSESVQKGGLSKWAGTSHAVKLPPLPPANMALPEQQVSGETEYSVGTGKQKRGAEDPSLTVKQSQVKWFHDLSENSKVSGYDIMIQGTEESRDYHLQLDLTQNAFGMFQGLREYLTEDGKVLYAVAYDQEGDSVLYVPEESATPSNADKEDQKTATASNSQAVLASPSNMPSGTILLNCILKAELEGDEDEISGIWFTLTLPDVAAGNWKGAFSEQYLAVYPDGMYRTEGIQIVSKMINQYYDAPEEEWFYLEKSLMERLEEGHMPEFNSADGALINDIQ